MNDNSSPTTPAISNRLSRRQFLKVAGAMGLSAAGLALLDACNVQPATPSAGGDMLETTTIRFGKALSICVAPQYLAVDLLKANGFTDVPIVDVPTSKILDALSTGQIDMAMNFSGPIISYLDAGQPFTVIAGIHVGCFKLFGNAGVNEIADLKGKMLAISAIGSPEHSFISSMLAYVGLNPNTDINWITLPILDAKQQFTDGKIDAFLGFPPIAQELEAKKIGHVVVNSMMDQPWSQYYCCMAVVTRDFLHNNPVATKRALRALLKATDITALQPERAAKLMVDKGYTNNYDYALKAMQEIPYNKWREYDPADTLRFYCLRLRDAGMVKSSPGEIIANGTDWQFLDQIKKEL